MKNLLKLVTLLCLLAPITGCLTTNPYVSPPNGGAMIIPDGPLWVTGTAEDGKREIALNEDYPQLTQTEHFKVNNAGYALMFRNGEMSASYVYVLNVTKPFSQKVYTRSVLDNPTDPQVPIIYTHYLMPEEKNSQVIHGPLKNVVAGTSYKLRFEVYANEERTQLLERVEQIVTASFDNTSGCIEMSPDARSTYMKATDPQGKSIPAEKVIFPCKRSEPSTSSAKNSPEPTASQEFLAQGAILTEIPSHGFIGDGIAIAAGGGAGNVNSLRGMLLNLQKTGTTQRVLISSGNKTLAKTVLGSAVKNLPAGSLSNLKIAYLGDINYGEQVRLAVESTGAELLTFNK